MRLIDADVLIEKFNEKVDMAECLIDERTAERFATFCALADAVEESHTVDAVPVVHGRWIEYTKVIIPEPYNKWEQAWKCSECGFDDGFVAYNYCPNCGAKMDGGAD